MEREWHTLHRIEEVSNLISFLRECKTNAKTRNAMRCNNRDEVFLPSRIYMVQRVFWENISGF